MKVIEAQSATLTNFEVYTHLAGVKKQYATTPRLDPKTGKPTGKTFQRQGPGNYETVVKEVMEYLTSSPSPLQQSLYGPTTIRTLLTRLKPYNLTKAEVLMILNLRPLDDCTLNMVVEEAYSRYTDELREEMITVIGEVLGMPESNENGVDEGDAMQT